MAQPSEHRRKALSAIALASNYLASEWQACEYHDECEFLEEVMDDLNRIGYALSDASAASDYESPHASHD